jgi:exodeoxyribonuclease V beta subunit
MTRVAKPAKLLELPADGSAIVEASAGTGKTFLLENVVLNLLIEQQLSPARLLVLTFARDAAANLKLRIRNAITEILAGKRPPPAPGQPAWNITDAIRAHLRRARLTLDDGMIGTIHAFCNQVLTDHAFSVGLPPTVGFDGGSDAVLAAIRDALRADLPVKADVAPYYQHWLEQRFVSPTALIKLLGKIAANPRPFFPAHDPAKASTLAHAVVDVKLPKGWRRSLPPELEGLVELLDLHRATLPKGPTTLDILRWRDDLAGAMRKYMDAKEAGDAPALPANAAGQLVAAVEQLLLTCPSAQSACIQVFWRCVEERLAARQWLRGTVTYNDMIKLLDRIGSGPAWNGLASRLRRAYGYGLLDEFQDTDPAQWSVFQRLFLDGAAPAPLYGVGDPKQAIYGFRGANIHAYFAAKSVIEDVGGNLVSLVENHRATADVIKGCNVLFGDTVEPYFTPPVTYTDVACGNPRISCTVNGKPITPFVIGHLAKANQKHFFALEIRRDLGRWIASEIEKLVGARGPIFADGRPDSKPRPLDYGDIFILTSARNDQLEIQQWLRMRRIPCVVDGADGGLLATPEAADVLRLLVAISKPFDPSACRAAWITPFFAVPIQDLLAMAGSSLERSFQDKLVSWRQLAEERKFHRLFGAVVAETGVICRDAAPQGDERRLTNYLHIFEHLRQLAAASSVDLEAMIELLAQAQDDDDKSPAGEAGLKERRHDDGCAVRITTMHKSKGLQRAVVFLYGGLGTAWGEQIRHGSEAGQQVWYVAPESWLATRADAERRNEWERLLYVGVTRAQARVYLPLVTPWNDQHHPGPMRLMNKRLEMLNDEEQLEMPLFERVCVPQKTGGTAVTGSTPPAPKRPRTTGGVASNPEANDASPLEERKPHEAVFITSYSQLTKGKQVEEHGGDDEDDTQDEPAPPPQPAPAAPVVRGRAFGVFVHAVIEEVPLASYGRAGGSYPAWLATAEVQEVVERLGRRFGYDGDARDQATRLAWAAMATKVTLLDGTVLDPGIAAADRALSEARILFPYPSAAGQGVRGFVTGAIDHVFAHGGRLYFADWKTDVVSGDGEEALRRSFDASGYDTQVTLYTLGLVKALGIQSEEQYERLFGGYLYCYLRPMAEGRHGVLQGRLTWEQLLAYEEERARA